MDANDIRELFDKHKEFFTGNSWILFILVITMFGNKCNRRELKSILTKMEKD